MGRGLPPHINAYLREQVEDLLDRNEWTGQELAARIGVTGASVSYLRNQGRGAGHQFEDGIARVLGITVDELRSRALAASKVATEPSVAEDSRVEYDGRYANLVAALEFLKLELHPVTLERASSLNAKAPTDLSRAKWVERLKILDEDVRAEMGAMPEAVAEEHHSRQDAINASEARRLARHRK